jgi:hypothetical protein
MKISTSIDFSRKRLVVSVTSNLLIDYYPNFEGLAKSSSGKRLPDKTEVTRESSDTAMLSFPIPLPSEPPAGPFGGEGEEQVQKIGVPMDLYSSVMGFIYLFTDKAIKAMDKCREYLPLKGYPEDKLQEDVKRALETGKDLLIVDTYQAWLDGMKRGERSFNQYLIKYKTDKSEYCDVVLMIMNGKFKEWRKKYKSQLKQTNWL